MEITYLSEERLKELSQELGQLKTKGRQEVALRLKQAKELGDLSENAEYDSAKEAQALNEGRIEDIKSTLENAVIITGNNTSGTVGVGSSIKVESQNGVRSFVIVGAAESDPAKGFISNESPLGQAFLGHKKGDKVEARTPKGMVDYKIVEIN